MGKSKRRSEWDRFRATTAVTDKMRTKEFSLKPKKSSGATTNKGQKAAKEDWKLKEREIRNSAAPLAFSERHYPQQFTIKKPEEE